MKIEFEITNMGVAELLNSVSVKRLCCSFSPEIDIVDRIALGATVLINGQRKDVTIRSTREVAERNNSIKK